MYSPFVWTAEIECNQAAKNSLLTLHKTLTTMSAGPVSSPVLHRLRGNFSKAVRFYTNIFDDLRDRASAPRVRGVHTAARTAVKAK